MEKKDAYIWYNGEFLQTEEFPPEEREFLAFHLPVNAVSFDSHIPKIAFREAFFWLLWDKCHAA